MRPKIFLGRRLRRMKTQFVGLLILAAFLTTLLSVSMLSGHLEKAALKHPNEVMTNLLIEGDDQHKWEQDSKNSLVHESLVINSIKSRDTNIDVASERRDALSSRPTPFQESVLQHMDANRMIYLATVDFARATMAVNLYLTSFIPFKIFNFLFVATDSTTCRFLENYGNLPCFEYFLEKNGNVSGSAGNQEIVRKTHYKTKIALDALRLGVRVVMVDVDIVFFKNPLPYFNCTFCDIQIQHDIRGASTGFYMVRPSAAAIELHEKAFKIGIRNAKLSGQQAVRKIMKSMTKKSEINVEMLSSELFPCGVSYFEKKRIMFRGDGVCEECVLVHNNWITSSEARIYRFRETGLWQVDIDQYYSDTDRKYLTYENPLDFGPAHTLKRETEALISALYIGHMLKRTVILPAFHCHGCKYQACINDRLRCSLNTFYNMTSFENNFGSLYREHVFLMHDKVPSYVKERQTKPILIKSLINEEIYNDVGGTIGQLFIPMNVSGGATVAEIRLWFEEMYAPFSILRFHSLYGATGMITDKKFSKRVLKALQHSDYRQYQLN